MRRAIAIVEGRTDDVLHAADTVVTASGTATVQTALHEKPMVIVYRLSPLTYRVGRPFVRVSTFGMANLIAGRTVVPELIQEAFTPARVAQETLRFLTDPAAAAEARRRAGGCAREARGARCERPRRRRDPEGGAGEMQRNGCHAHEVWSVTRVRCRRQDASALPGDLALGESQS